MSYNEIEKKIQEINFYISTAHQSLSQSLFSKHEFLEHQKKVQNKDYIVFSLCELESNKILSQLILSRNKGNAVYDFFAPITGAFSDFYLAKERIALNKIQLFLTYIEAYLQTEFKIKRISYKLPPECYNSNNNNYLLNAMFIEGWKVNNIDLNYHLDLINGNEFRKNLSSSKRRELNRISREDLFFARALETGEINAAYNIIKANRESQGYPMTMKWDDLYSLYLAMPEDIFFFNLKKDNSIIASAVCLKINNEQMYVFYWGENPEFRKLSPIVKLAEQLYLYFSEKGFKSLDIGISTDNSFPNQGLIDFKTNIGCQLTKKITMTKLCGE